MLIRCKLPEHDNIEVFQGTKYHFIKNSAGVLVCDVQDDDAATKFLLNSAVYEPYDDAAVEAEKLARAKAGQVDQDEEDSESSDDEDGDGFFEEQTGELPGITKKVEPETKADPYENATLEELQSIYKQRFGKAAHPSTKHETLLAKLRESDAKAGE